MQKKLVIAAIVATHLAAPATSGDLDSPVGQEWSGAYIGLNLGKPSGESKWEDRFDDGTGSSSGSEGWDGVAISGKLGGDLQLGNLVVGIAVSRATNEIRGVTKNAPFYGCEACLTNILDLTRISGRIGIARNRNLFYVTGGSAEAYAIATWPGRDGTVYGEGDLSGWTAGIGVERWLSDRLTISGEVSMTDLGRLDLPGVSDIYYNFTDVRFGMVEVGMNLRW